MSSSSSSFAATSSSALFAKFWLIYSSCLILSQNNTEANNIFTKAEQRLKHIVDPLASISTNPEDVGFYLFPNSENLTDFDEILLYGNLTSAASASQSRLNRNLATVLLIHGFKGSYQGTFPQNVKDAYLQNGYQQQRFNIILVDWSKLTFKPTDLYEDIFYLEAYKKSCENVPIVGKRVEEFLLELVHNNGGSGGGSRIHLIGFSLGAHVAGMAARYFGNATGTLIARVTGLDPAGPSFQDVSPENRLDKSVAQFVDVIHTNQGELGFIGSLGHVDFFVNGGGPVQPFCKQLEKSDNFLKNARTASSCSHAAAPSASAYAKSIGKTTLIACPSKDADEESGSECDRDPSSEKIIFGENCPSSARGNYYIEIDFDEQ